MGKLAGKVALVTGSGRSIGRAIALQLADEGARVVVNDIDAEPAQEVVAEIRRAGGEAIACVGSVTDPDFAARFINVAIETYADLHIIVNNAGYTWDAVIQNMSEEQFDAMMDVHVKAPWRILQAALKFIRVRAREEAQNGREIVRKVVNISSISGTRGSAGQSNYSAAKTAVHGLTRTLAKEWGRYRVTVNCVAFGLIHTRLTVAADEKKLMNVGGRKIPVGIPTQNLRNAEMAIPLGRGGTPAEAAGAVLLFCLPGSDYISGQVIEVTGGL